MNAAISQANTKPFQGIALYNKQTQNDVLVLGHRKNFALFLRIKNTTTKNTLPPIQGNTHTPGKHCVAFWYKFKDHPHQISFVELTLIFSLIFTHQNIYLFLFLL